MNIYVGRLPSAVNETKLRSLFEQYGAVDSIKLIKDKFTGQLKGFAFIEMPDNDHALEAINALNGFDLEGQRILVSEARPREARPPRPYGGGGGNGGSNGGGSRGGPRTNRFGSSRY
jgi:RNA recognition motif-containing protein